MADTEAEIVLRLPDSLRGAFKEPMGAIETDAEVLVGDISGPLIAVGDVVTYHFERIGHTPDVAVIDGLTERDTVEPEVADVLEASGARRIEATNPAAALSASILRALREAVGSEEPVAIDVEGEEDLVTLPALVLAPEGASVVYGQPGEGMVHVRVDEGTRERARDLLERMDGDHGRLWELLEG
ncbi:GTP-dependent dephospho-CoA kinase family protein [Halalkalicoccus sp. NIPERK01]|uniref:GTP-dependent dephospho-CoA kinase family protein n=1 Tax=Halalkalicoccus sp. NIPERK01 TaxID=3053469 RepID=UPI00256F009D|nr:GTP-dependent dephospho-CoA kinase family protein [Halalkalicoccus sp. NIPERK01]MDL5362263.1 GTP-dependent dephospho-CoA kinase family protein [Halalkalicoccus sp. NIPERK01]